MKFSFINASPFEMIKQESDKILLPASWPPLGILYLATVLQQNGIEVSVLDQPAKGFTIDEVVKWIEKEDPNILGFSTISTSGPTAGLISNEIKKKNPNILIILGGYYATFNHTRIFKKYPAIDLVVRGEGENIVLDLVDWFKNDTDFKRIRGISFKDENSIVTTPNRPLIEDLDSIPMPDRSLLDVEYHSTIAGANIAVEKFTSVLSSRGCVHRCIFCSSQKFSCTTWRPRSIGNILNELHYLTSEGFKQFIFVDDNFTLNPKRVIDLCRTMRREKLDFEWFCEGRVDSCSYELMNELSKAGCKVLFFGIESANQRILDYYKKRITPGQSEKAIKTARRTGIDVIVGSFILGAPDETRKEIQNTLEFAKKLPIDYPRFNILEAEPGTELWDELKMKNFLKEEDYWESGVSVSKICPTAVPFHEISLMIEDAFKHFVYRPTFILSQIGRLVRSHYRLKTLRKNLKRVKEILNEVEVLKRLD